ncbi:PHB depolymerase family esterase [Achromobacter sp. KS-M25]|nr:PHB depolymerase family esterase [Achromobacter aestuarii]
MARKRSSLLIPTLKKWSRLQRTLLGLGPLAPVKRSATRKKPLGGSRTLLAPKPTALVRKPGVVRRPVGPKTLRPSALGAGDCRHMTFFAKPEGAAAMVRLSYALYWPKHADLANLPLMVMLHGCQQTVQDFAAGSRMNRLADKEGFAVLYPQQSRTRQSHRCWRWFQPDDRGGCLEADALAMLIHEVLAQHPLLDGSRVYVAGLSAGAGMAALLALRHPETIAAVAMHSGPVVGDALDVRAGLRTMKQGAEGEVAALVAPYANTANAIRLPAMVLHGKEDAVVAPRNAHQLVEQFLHVNQLTGAKPTSVKSLADGKTGAYRRTDYVKGRKTLVRWCELAHVGHAWSGGDEALKFNTRSGPDASVLIWRFVSAHRRTLAPV